MRQIALKQIRKWRRRAFWFQRNAGNWIALLRGPRAYLRRIIRRRLHRMSGKQINLLRK